MLYPLKFVPVMKNYLWGGRALERLGKVLPEGATAESWEISGHADGLATVADGIYAGLTLPELAKRLGKELIGCELPQAAIENFPLLIKLIDANDKLSVQVHPGDEYAYANENGSLGKTEMWVILDAKPGARIIYGLVPGVTKDKFEEAIAEGNVSSCLMEVPVQKGDAFEIPAGLVHAIGEGLLIAEIQQSSNTTYRVYDYDRIDEKGCKRDLHIRKALEVIDFGYQPSSHAAYSPKSNGEGAATTSLVCNKYFEVESISLGDRNSGTKGILRGNADGSRFEFILFTEGSCSFAWSEKSLEFSTGDTVLVPAYLGEYVLEGSCTALRGWVP